MVGNTVGMVKMITGEFVLRQLTMRLTKQNYMTTLKPYTNEVKDTIIDALKANLKGVTVLTSA